MILISPSFCPFHPLLFSLYSGAQVAVASFTVNYIVDQNIGINKSHASQLFSYCQITFTVGRFVSPRSDFLLLCFDNLHDCIDRFVGVALLNFIDPALLLSFYGFACAAFSLGVTFGPGKSGIGCLFTLFFFESICYPVIFTLATANLGKHTKKGSGLIVMVCICFVILNPLRWCGVSQSDYELSSIRALEVVPGTPLHRVQLPTITLVNHTSSLSRALLQ